MTATSAPPPVHAVVRCSAPAWSHPAAAPCASLTRRWRARTTRWVDRYRSSTMRKASASGENRSSAQLSRRSHSGHGSQRHADSVGGWCCSRGHHPTHRYAAVLPACVARTAARPKGLPEKCRDIARCRVARRSQAGCACRASAQSVHDRHHPDGSTGPSHVAKGCPCSARSFCVARRTGN